MSRQAKLSPRPLAIATSPAEEVAKSEPAVYEETGMEKKKMGHGVKLVICFIIVFIVIWFILYMAHPTFVQNLADKVPDGTIDNFKCILYSIIVAAIVTFIVWLFIRRK